MIKSEKIDMRVTPEQKKVFEKLASDKELNLSIFIKELAVNYIFDNYMGAEKHDMLNKLLLQNVKGCQ